MGDSIEYIARISYGKDSLKMLDVIWTRGLPLDRITTTDVWATDTISANLPEMDAFKAKIDKRIKELYGIEVEHLCARNPDGSKRTYEQMFYHVPVRRSQTLNVERERERAGSGREQSVDSPTCGIVGVSQTSSGLRAYRRKDQSKGSLVLRESIGARSSRLNGFPVQISPWCRKLKIDKAKTPFPMSAASQRAKTEILWSTSA